MFTNYRRTKISRKNMKKIRNKRLSARDITEYLKTGATFHSFEYVLNKVYPCEDLQKEVIEKMAEVSDLSSESVSRNVRNWLSGRFLPSRDDLFLLVFALHLSLENADYLLGSCSDSGIHYRNPKELIYAYGLNNCLEWKEITEIQKRLLPECEERMRDVHDDASYKEMISKQTRQIEEEFQDGIDSEEKLEEFLMEKTPYLAYLHLTAYEDFMSMIKLLQKVDLHDKKMSIKEVVEYYLQFGAKKKSDGTQPDYLAKVILKNWPSSSNIYKMQTKRQDVSRKVMILLFLVTEEFMSGDNLWTSKKNQTNNENSKYDNFLNKGYRWSTDDILEVRIELMNMYLKNYGMNLLDPGYPFDCLVLYALKASYEDRKGMSERFNEALNKLFPDELSD